MRERLRWIHEGQDGFTLVELMVVTVILGVLMAMTFTTYAGTRARSHDSAAKQMATRALETGRIVLTDTGSYAAVDAASLDAAEGSASFLDGTEPSTGTGEVSTDVPDAATTGLVFVAAVYSPSGTCFYVRDWIYAGQGVGYGSKPGVTPASCTAADTAEVAWAPRWS